MRSRPLGFRKSHGTFDTAAVPVANVAMAIGRVVSGANNKVMNFRFIDPGEPKIGLSSIDQMDHVADVFLRR
jgi:hypothetical protein